MLLFVTIGCVSLSQLQNKDLSFFTVNGRGMSPTIPNNATLIIDNKAYVTDPPSRGDIVVYTRRPFDKDLFHIKRVVGLPNETIQIDKQGLIINGEILDEPYISELARYSGSWVLGDNEYFILGDNRNDNADSHLWGAVMVDDILGKAIMICTSKQLDSCEDL
ncbi:signal peptidase I [candidate division WWE3 bacterium]|uniref:Signal peptidase I n=1 Tax=candidate division WWE3 bacterium TaxID=2053526 RepID=A0A955LWN3_UNCKA|nr:signal peptidase I [candidate division WWE3 bacterium]